jgi:tetratricopeptide (TPR) repeat protein
MYRFAQIKKRGNLRILTIVSIIWIVFSYCPIAQGDDERDADAKIQFQQGVLLFEEGKFEQASIAFGRAYELRPNFRILWNLGQVENELEHYAAALVAYKGYIEEGKESVPVERAEEAAIEIERLKPLVGTIVVRCPIEGAKVKVDNEAKGKTPLQEKIFVDLGKHEIKISKGKDIFFEETIKIAGAQELIIEIETEDEATSPSRAPVVAVSPSTKETQEGTNIGTDESQNPKRVWTWVAFGLGGAAAVGAAITGGLSLSQVGDIKDQCDNNDCPKNLKADADAAATLGNTSTALAIVAAVGVTLGTILYFVEPDSEKEKQDSIVLVPSALPAGAALTLSGRF